jgi:hypothetical protein
MKPKDSFGNARRKPSGKVGSRASTQMCRELAVQVTNIKNGLVREFGTAIGGQTQLLRAALNEAEALAWQTPYPHLLFPVLAAEKASAVSRWAARQRTVPRASREMSLAE